MKTLALTFALVLGLLQTAHADPLTLAHPAPHKSARRVTGQVLSAVGIALSLVGAGLALSTLDPNRSRSDDAGLLTEIGMFSSFGMGLLTTAIGVPLWVVGARYEKQVRGYAQATGLTVTF